MLKLLNKKIKLKLKYVIWILCLKFRKRVGCGVSVENKTVNVSLHSETGSVFNGAYENEKLNNLSGRANAKGYVGEWGEGNNIFMNKI